MLFPVNEALEIFVTNLQPFDATIEGYAVWKKAKDGKWVELVRLDAIGMNLYFATNLQAANQWKLTNLEDVFAEGPIHPHTTQEGWAYFEYPKSGVGFTDEYKVMIRDMEGPYFIQRPWAAIITLRFAG